MFARKLIIFSYTVLFFAFLSVPETVAADNARRASNSATCCDDSTNVEFPVVYFASNSAALDASESAKLDRIASTLANFPSLKLLVVGHTDSQGSVSFNQALSARRAGAVVNYLTDRGVDSARLTSDAHSESRPMAANAHANGRAENRRVVFIKQ